MTEAADPIFKYDPDDEDKYLTVVDWYRRFKAVEEPVRGKGWTDNSSSRNFTQVQQKRPISL